VEILIVVEHPRGSLSARFPIDILGQEKKLDKVSFTDNIITLLAFVVILKGRVSIAAKFGPISKQTGKE
jgi:hypothetical protein